MGELFLSLWNRAYAAGWLILAVLALRLVLRRAPKSVRCLLWLLVGLRLVLPAFPQAPVSLVPSAEVVSPEYLERNSFRVSTGIPYVNARVNDYLGDHYYEGITVPVRNTARVAELAGRVWLAGLALLALYGLWSWWRLRRQVRGSVREDGFRRCGGIPSPFLLGLVRPEIYVPRGLEGPELGFVLAHERAHLARRDHWTKPAAYALLSVYWFHPLVWAAYVLLCRDIELACDERVVRELGEDSKAAYSRALLRCSVSRASIVCPLAFGEVGVKERVRNILRYRKPALWVAAVSLLLCGAAAVCFLTDPAEAEDRPDSGNAPAQTAGQPSSGAAPEDTEKQPAGSSASDAPRHYTGGALIGQDAGLSAWFPVGWQYSDVWEEGGVLTVVDNKGEEWSGSLTETAGYTPEGFFALFDSRPILPNEIRAAAAGATAVTVRRYGDGERTETLWELSLEGGGTTLWIGDLRVYQLIDPFAAFIGGSGALWAWEYGSLLPVRFSRDLGTVEVAASAGQLYQQVGEEMRPAGRSLTLAPGGTVCWDPAVGGTVPADAALTYTFGEGEEQLSLRPLMGETRSGVRTYGVTNNWLGAASSAVFRTCVTADAETCGVLVGTVGEGPYTLQTDLPAGTVTGLYRATQAMDRRGEDASVP